MGIFFCFIDIVNLNINVLLDKVEDFEKMVCLIIQEMEDIFVEVCFVFVKIIVNKKEIVF